MSGLGVLVKGAKAARKGEPFFSAVDEAAQGLARGKGTGKEFMTELIKIKGVKPTEIKERGLQKIEAMPKMTKEQFLQELEKRPAPQITETGYAEEPDQEAFADAFRKAVGHLPENKRMKAWFDMPEKERNKLLASAEARNIYEPGTKYGNERWQLPGGANYREILLKVPSTSSAKAEESIRVLRKEYDDYGKRADEIRKQFPVISERPPEAQTELMDFRAKQSAIEDQIRQVRKDASSYHSSHWEEDPNVLAHIRVSDREGPNGEQILHIEEIQSDWHQAGRRKRDQEVKRIMKEQGITKKEAQALVPEDFGYKTGEEQSKIDEMLNKQEELKRLRKELHNKAGALPDGREDEFIALMDQANDITPQVMKLQTEIDKLSDMQRSGVPDAPFKKNWHELAMKRVLNYAADQGYDKVVITPGAEQASRYDLSKHINEISYGKNPDGTYSLTAIDKNGKPAISNMKLSESDLENTVGKEIAEKIIQGQGAEFPAGSVSEGKKALSGLDLQVGGEGMKGFYDKILPDYLNNFGKKYGVQVEMENYPIKISDDLNFPVETSEANGLPSHVPGEQRMVHSFNITPEMRQDITGKGLPLYQQIGIPTAGAAAGAESLQTEEPGYADGGVVMAAKGGEFDTEPDMADGGARIQGTAFKKGGRVHITDNPDRMLLDLLSRN